MKGVVVARTSDAAFLRLANGRLVAVHSPSLPAFPFSWVSAGWRGLDLRPGADVELGRRHLRAGDIAVAGRPVAARRIDRSPRTAALAAQALREVRPSPAAHRACQVLERGIRDRDLAGALVNVLGRGPGLTPSGDDVVVGLLAGLALAARCTLGSDLTALLRRLLPRLEGRTTSVSAAVLRCAVEGRFAPVVADVAARSGLGASGARAAVARLAGIGASSGRDMLAGMALATRASTWN